MASLLESGVLTASYESSAAISYLVLKMNDNAKIINYQIDMIAENEFSGIIGFDFRIKNSISYLNYNITSKVSISQFLKRQKLNREDFLDILHDIVKPLLGSNDYLLSESQFILDEEYIFINPATKEISLVYVPVKVNYDILSGFKDLVLNMITKSANIDERTGDSFVVRILNCIKSDVFNLIEFDKLLKDLRDSRQVSKKNIEGYKDENKVIVPVKQIDVGKKPQFEMKNQEENILKIPMRNTRIPGVPEKAVNKAIPGAKKQEVSEGKSKSSVKSNVPNPVFIAVMSQIIIIIAITLLATSVKISDPVSTYGGIGIIVLAGDFLLFRKLFGKKDAASSEGKTTKKQKDKSTFIPPNNVNISKREIRSVPKHRDTEVSCDEELSKKSTNNYSSNYEDEFSFSESTSVLSDEGDNDTMVLGHTPMKNAVLRSEKAGITDEIAINKPCFAIGRLKQQVDYIVDNKYVGNLHSEIIIKDGLYYIKDINSRNGTFVNGSRIDSNVEVEIRNNDKISFANSEYIFIVPM